MTEQSSSGDQSPNISTEQGDVTISYGLSLSEYEAGLEAIHKRFDSLDKSSISEEKYRVAISEKADIEKELADIKASFEAYKKDFKEQIESLEKAEEVSPNVRLSEAKHALICGDTKKAEAMFLQIAEESTAHILAAAEAVYQRGKLAKNSFSYMDAHELFREAVRLSPANSVYIRAAGSTAQILNYQDEALEFYDLALREDMDRYGSTDINVGVDYNNRANVLMELRRFDDAVTDLEKSLSVFENLGKSGEECLGAVYNNLSQAWRYLDDDDKLNHYQELSLAWTLSTPGAEVAGCYNNIGSTLVRQGKAPEAIPKLELGIAEVINNYGKTHPKLCLLYTSLGNAYFSLDDHPRAIRYFKMALKNSSTLHSSFIAKCHINIGKSWAELKKYKRAIKSFEQALTYGQDAEGISSTYNNLGLAYVSLYKYPIAIKYFELALEEDIDISGRSIIQSNLARVKSGMSRT
jgi:tetratricopeptide (TPR) repeat protein